MFLLYLRTMWEAALEAFSAERLPGSVIHCGRACSITYPISPRAMARIRAARVFVTTEGFYAISRATKSCIEVQEGSYQGTLGREDG